MRAAAIAMLAGCSFTAGKLPGPLPDATPDVRADAIVFGPWAAPTMMFPGGGDDDATLTSDLLELYFNRLADIYVTTRPAVGAAWSAPVLVAELSSIDNETTPEITGDGLTIFVGSARPGGLGAGDIWMSTRTSRTAAWGAPVDVGTLSSTEEDAASAPTDDQRAIVFISARLGGVGGRDLYQSVRDSPFDAWGTPENLATVNTTAEDYSPVLSQDRLTLWFDSTRSLNDDLYVATRASSDVAFDPAQPIAELDTVGVESDIWVSADQRYLVFCRDGTLYETTR